MLSDGPATTAWHMVIASAAAVASSSIEALAMSSAGQIGYHRLKIQQRFEPPLRDLRLVRRVGRVPARVFQDIPLDYRRGDAIRIARADKGMRHLITQRD